MKLTKCSNGHFYDADKYSECPHCEGGSVKSSTSSTSSKTNKTSNTKSENPSKKIKTEDENNMHKTIAKFGTNGDVNNNSGLTQAINNPNFMNLYDKEQNGENVQSGKNSSKERNRSYVPVCGWIVGISGPEYGHSYELYLIDNSIGSGDDNIISIKNDSYLCANSHAIISFDSANQVFYLDYNRSEGKILVNNYSISESVYLKYMDVLQIGSSSYMLVPLCKDGFTWWPNTEIDYVGQDNNTLSHSSDNRNSNISYSSDTIVYEPEVDYYSSNDFSDEEQDITGLLVSSPWRCMECNALNSSMFSRCRTCGEERYKR